jgi:hypothetical protein
MHKCLDEVFRLVLSSIRLNSLPLSLKVFRRLLLLEQQKTYYCMKRITKIKYHY